MGMPTLNPVQGWTVQSGHGHHLPLSQSSPGARIMGVPHQRPSPVPSYGDSKRGPVWAQVQTQLAYRQVGEWFQSWRSWQQKILLCGLTNRCSNQQLESMATTLEPLLHRDFLNSLKKRYPSAPFKNVKQRAHVTSRARALMQKAEALRIERQMEKERVFDESLSHGNLNSGVEDDAQGKGISLFNPAENPDVDNSSTTKLSSYPGLDQFADKMAQTILADVVKSSEQSVTAFAANFVQNIISNAAVVFQKELNTANEDMKQETMSDEIDFLGNLKDPVSVGNVVNSLNDQEVENDSRSTAVSYLHKGSPTSMATGFGSVNNTVKVETSVALISPEQYKMNHCDIVAEGTPGMNYKNKLDLHVSGEKSKEALLHVLWPVQEQENIGEVAVEPIADEQNIGNTCKFNEAKKEMTDSAEPGEGSSKQIQQRHAHSALSFHSQASHSVVSQDSRTLLHHHRSNIASPDVHSMDFFSREKILKLGPVKAGLRTGRVNCLPQLQDISVPVQKLYKNAKLWHSLPSEDHSYVRPRKSALKWHFRQQINRVWEWMEQWQEHERLSLLVDIIKLCDSDTLSYLAQCLFQRLRERVDINWLPDRLLLLVFSYLAADDINTCAKVSRRFRYLCHKDELWMIKCHEYGLEQGIEDMIELVQEANTEGQGIDWPLAYQELRQITDEAQSAMPMPRFRLSADDDVSSTKTWSARTWRLSRRGSMASLGTKLSSNKLRATCTPSQRKESSLKCIPESIRRPSRKIVLSKGKGWGAVASLVSKDTGKPLLLRRARGSSMHPASLPGSQTSATQGRDHSSAVETGQSITGTVNTDDENAMGTKTVKQWIRGGRRRSEGELALDVRPDPIQCKDLLDENAMDAPLHSLRFRVIDEKEAVIKMKSLTRNVASIKRCRKLQGHMDAVLCVEMDRCRLISGSMDRTIRIWDIRSGRSLHKLLGHKGGVCSLQFEGPILYSGSWDMTIMVWDLVYFKRKAVLTGHKGTISCLKMCDSFIVSGSHDCTVRVWRRNSLTCKHVLEGHTSIITCMHYDGFTLITGSADKTIIVTDVHTGECLNVFSGPEESIEGLVVSRNLMVTCTPVGQIFFWTCNTGHVEAAIQAHSSGVNKLAFYKGHLYTAADDGSVKEWDIITLTCVRILQGHKGPVQDFKVNGRYMVSCSNDGHIRIWDLSSGKQTDGVDEDIPIQVVTKDELAARSDLRINTSGL